MDELVKRLRAQAVYLPEKFSKNAELLDVLMKAADTIEELVRKEKFHAFLWNTIQPNEMEAYISMYNAGDEKEES